MPILIISFLVLFSPLGRALPIDLIAQDILQIGDNIEYQSSVSGGSHQLILSAPKRINNDLVIEKDQWVKGDIYRVLVRLSSSSSLTKYSELFIDLMRSKGKLEFQCQQRGCGVSSYWANNIFEERRLSGRDSDQYYIAGTVSYEGESYWLAVYLVTNALRQNLAYISYIKHEGGADWKNGYQIPSEGNIPDGVLKSLEQEMLKNTDLVLYIAVYLDSSKIQSVSSMQNLTANSLKEIRTHLTKVLKVQSSRIQTQFVGGAHTQTNISEADYWFRLFLFNP